MSKSILSEKCTKKYTEKCQICGATNEWRDNEGFYKCEFCNFKKIQTTNDKNKEGLVYATDINQYFKDKYNSLKTGEICALTVPVCRFYNIPIPKPGQINFFTSKNIMFLLEQHGFQMVSRKSRFSSQLNLIIRRV